MFGRGHIKSDKLAESIVMTKTQWVTSMAGQVALVTGATGHLGTHIVSALGEAGAHVLVNSRSHERANSVVQDLKQRGLSAESAVFNITSETEVEEFFDGYTHKRLDVIVNNAYTGGSGTISVSSGFMYRESYEVTVVAAHVLLRCGLPYLREAVRLAGGASVINIGSMYGLVSPDLRLYESAEQSNPPFYGAAKAALLNWTRYAACEFGKEGIRVNALSPGPFPSAEVQATMPDFVSALKKKVPLRRVGSPEEIEGPVLFLASSASSFVNGSNLVVDGGWTCW